MVACPCGGRAGRCGAAGWCAGFRAWRGLEVLVHVECGVGFARGADDDGRYARHGGVGRYVGEDDGGCGDFGALADFDAAEDFGPGSDEDSGADDGVAVAVFFAGAAEGDFVEDGDVVFDDGGFSDDESGAVVEEDAAADAGGGVDVDGEGFGGEALEEVGHEMAAFLPEGVGDAVG